MNPQVGVELENHICPSCGTAFAIACRVGESLRDRGGEFFCPNGHVCTYGDTEVKRLRERLAREQSAHAQTRAAKETAERRLQRVARGVCPCCKRHFMNVERHVARKHPGFKR